VASTKLRPRSSPCWQTSRKSTRRSGSSLKARKAKVRLGFLSLGIGVLGIVLAVFAVAFALVGVLMALAGFACAVILWVSAYRYGRNLRPIGGASSCWAAGGEPATRQRSKAPVKVSLGLKDRARFSRKRFGRCGARQTAVYRGRLALHPGPVPGRRRILGNDAGADSNANLHQSTRQEQNEVPVAAFHRSPGWPVPKDSYGDLRPLEEGLEKEPPSAGFGDASRSEVGEKAVFLKVRVAEAAELSQANVMLFLGLYRALNLARQMQGRQK